MNTTPGNIDYQVFYEEQLIKIAELKHELDQLKKMIFAARSERFLPLNGSADQQLSLDIAQPIVATAPVKTRTVTYTTPATSQTQKVDYPVRMKLPEHLRRKDIVLEPENIEGCRRIGEEITEELEYEPGKLFVNRFIRPKYVCGDNQQFIIAPMVERPLPKAIAGPGLLARIVIDKYVDHLPLHRQQERFKRQQVNIPYSTITDWVSSTCKLIHPSMMLY